MVFGGIKRGTKECFLVPVEDRKADTLIPIIKKFIKLGTKIMSDCWKAYSTIEEEGYIHGTVNHSIEFVHSETDYYTQMIDNTWRAAKRSLPRSGTKHDMDISYFAEFLFRRKYLDDEGRDPLVTFFSKVKEAFPPNQ